MLRIATCCAFMLMLTTNVGTAQSDWGLHKAGGKWEAWRGVRRDPGSHDRLARADSAAMARIVERVRDLAKTFPALQPSGYDVRPLGYVNTYDDYHPIQGTFAAMLFMLPRARGDESPITFRIHLNPSADVLVSRQMRSDPDLGPVWLEPERNGDYGGFPVYGTSSPMVLVTHRKELPWIPITQEEELRAALRDERPKLARAEASAAKAKTEYAAEMGRRQVEQRRSRIASLEAKLNAMSAAERAAPAIHCVTVERQCAPKEIRPLVRRNPAFYDKTVARTAVQAIVVWQNYTATKRDPSKLQERLGPLSEALLRDLDWQALAELLTTQ